MQENGLLAVMRGLGKYHDTSVTDEALSDYISVLSRYDVKAIETAVAEWKYQHGPRDRFPSIADLLGLYHEARTREWQKRKEKSPTLADAAQQANTERGEHVLGVIQEFLHGKINRDDYIAWMREQEKIKSGVGWRKEATRLEIFWATEKERNREGANFIERIETLRKEADSAKRLDREL